MFRNNFITRNVSAVEPFSGVNVSVCLSICLQGMMELTLLILSLLTMGVTAMMDVLMPVTDQLQFLYPLFSTLVCSCGMIKLV